MRSQQLFFVIKGQKVTVPREAYRKADQAAKALADCQRVFAGKRVALKLSCDVFSGRRIVLKEWRKRARISLA